MRKTQLSQSNTFPELQNTGLLSHNGTNLSYYETNDIFMTDYDNHPTHLWHTIMKKTILPTTNMT